MHPFLYGIVVGFIALMAGWLGGVGGRCWRDRHRYAETEERFESLERRLSKREGQAGRAQRDSTSKADLETLAQLQRMLPRGSAPAPFDDPDAAAARHWREKDKAKS